ncbi:hypothetical protein [Streptomyces sp. NPDC005374]|uniref:hypothetical protein n=1 Tax=Streptomyces sp. NPDC005374 TaxID=3364713 RepID=UPI0036B6953C
MDLSHTHRLVEEPLEYLRSKIPDEESERETRPSTPLDQPVDRAVRTADLLGTPSPEGFGGSPAQGVHGLLRSTPRSMGEVRLGAAQSQTADYERVLDAVTVPVTEAYYAQRVQSGLNARLRAQAAQSTITLFAGGLFATLTFTALADRGKLTQIVAVAAVALWLIAALLYMSAVALPVADSPGPDFVKTREALVKSVLDKAKHEAEEIDRRQARANRVAGAAVVMSVVTFGLGVLLEPEEKTGAGIVVVDPSYRTTLAALCGKGLDRVTGTIVNGSLSAQFIEVKPDRGSCAGQDDVLRIPRSAVEGVRLSDG